MLYPCGWGHVREHWAARTAKIVDPATRQVSSCSTAPAAVGSRTGRCAVARLAGDVLLFDDVSDQQSSRPAPRPCRVPGDQALAAVPDQTPRAPGAHRGPPIRPSRLGVTASVSVIVSILQVPGVDVGVLVGLSVVVVLVRVLHMLMIMPEMCVAVGHIVVRVLMSVRRGHPCPLFLAWRDSAKAPIGELIGPQYRGYTSDADYAPGVHCDLINAESLH
jgi:hypothetical protein